MANYPPRSSTLWLCEQGCLAGLCDTGMVINQIREVMGIQAFKCILFFVPVVEAAGNIIPSIMVGYRTSLLPKSIRIILTPRVVRSLCATTWI